MEAVSAPPKPRQNRKKTPPTSSGQMLAANKPKFLPNDPATIELSPDKTGVQFE